MARCIIPNVLKLYEQCMKNMYNKNRYDDVMLSKYSFIFEGGSHYDLQVALNVCETDGLQRDGSSINLLVMVRLLFSVFIEMESETDLSLLTHFDIVLVHNLIYKTFFKNNSILHIFRWLPTSFICFL